jgi:hypothetical protein
MTKYSSKANIYLSNQLNVEHPDDTKHSDNAKIHSDNAKANPKAIQKQCKHPFI